MEFILQLQLLSFDRTIFFCLLYCKNYSVIICKYDDKAIYRIEWYTRPYNEIYNVTFRYYKLERDETP